MRQCDASVMEHQLTTTRQGFRQKTKKNCNVRVMRRDDSEHCISSNVVTKMW